MAKYRVLILYIKAGQGHYGISQSLADSLNFHFPDEFENFIEDALPEEATLFQAMFQAVYSFFSNYLIPIYALGYYSSSFPPIHFFLLWLMKNRTKRHLQAIVRRIKPHIIVLTHPLLQTVVHELNYRGIIAPEFVHLVVDLKPLYWYFKQRDTHLIVSTERLKNYACRKLGFNEEDICACPPPLRKEFYDHYDEKKIRELKKKYGFAHDRHIILIFGGGNGLPLGDEIVRQILKHHAEADIAVVCGRNEFMKNRIQALSERHDTEGRKVHNFGFVDFIHELMVIADIVISKAGFSGIFEVLTLGKILIFSQFIWGQEKGNANFVVRNGIGYYIKNPFRVAQKVKTLLNDYGQQQKILANISRMRLTNGAYQSAAFIKKILEKRFKM